MLLLHLSPSVISSSGLRLLRRRGVLLPRRPRSRLGTRASATRRRGLLPLPPHVARSPPSCVPRRHLLPPRLPTRCSRAHVVASLARPAASRVDLLAPDHGLPFLVPREGHLRARLLRPPLRPRRLAFPPHNHPFIQALASDADGPAMARLLYNSSQLAADYIPCAGTSLLCAAADVPHQPPPPRKPSFIHGQGPK